MGQNVPAGAVTSRQDIVDPSLVEGSEEAGQSAGQAATVDHRVVVVEASEETAAVALETRHCKQSHKQLNDNNNNNNNKNHSNLVKGRISVHPTPRLCSPGDSSNLQLHI